MANPQIILQGSVKETSKWIGVARKWANQTEKAGIRRKSWDLGGATVQVEHFGSGMSRVLIKERRRITTGFAEFESAIIRFTWGNESGRDLDTVTYIKTPDFRFDAVGWTMGNAFTPFGETDINACYLFWNGDNVTSVGSEAVLVNFKKLIDDYPGLDNFEILIHANWFAVKGNGQITLSFETYIGGTFDTAIEEYNIINTGGTLVENISKSVTVSLQEAGAYPGQLIGTLTYNRITNVFSLV